MLIFLHLVVEFLSFALLTHDMNKLTDCVLFCFTGLTFTYLSAKIPVKTPKVIFSADHPFVLAIVSQADDVLFLGRLTKP